MRAFGFSTGALAYSDFRSGLRMLVEEHVPVIELSALRFREWMPLLDALGGLDLSSFEYVSLHLPSALTAEEEQTVAHSLHQVPHLLYPLVLHPDAISNWELWQGFGSLLCIENMDSRKPIGRTASELAEVFTRLPEAGLCFDIGHAWQIDPTMGEAYWILKWFGGRLRQLHVSEVNSRSKHDVLSFATIQSFKEVAHMIPDDVPIVLETPVGQSSIQSEIKKARFALAAGSSPIPTSAGDLSLIAR